jgi:hypothetical protein
MSKRHLVAAIVVLFFTTLFSFDTANAGLFRHRRCHRAGRPCSCDKPASAPVAPCTSDKVCPKYPTEPMSNPDPVLYYAIRCPSTPVPWYGAKGHLPGTCSPCVNCEPPGSYFQGRGKHELVIEDKWVNDGISVVGPLDPAKAFDPKEPGVTFKLNHSRFIKFEHLDKKMKPKTVFAQYFDVTFNDPKLGDLRVVFAREVNASPEEATPVKTKKHNTKHVWDIEVDFEKEKFTIITNSDTLDQEKP